MPKSTNPSHADVQRAYHARKRKTHSKVCVWVPKEHLEAFKKSVSRMRRKWGSV